MKNKKKKKSGKGYDARHANKTARRIVEEYLRRTGNPHIDEIIELIAPLYRFDEEDLIDKELKRRARYIMSTFKDKKKVRIYFSDSSGVYINVDKTQDLVELSKVNRQLSVKYSGLNSAIAKVRGKIEKIVGKFRVGKGHK